MSAIYANGVTILNHTVLKKKMKDNFKMIQISNKAVEVRVKNDQSSNSDFQIIMTLGMNIKGIDCCGSHTLFWNGKFAQLYDVQGTKGPQLLGNFESNSACCALTEDSVVQCANKELQVCNYHGEVKQVLPLTEQEGDIIKIDARGKFMAVVTSMSMIKIFDISRRTYKQLGITRRFEIKNGEQIGEIKDIALNSDGKKLAILADVVLLGSNRIPDRKFYIYDIDMDNFMSFEVSKNRVPIEAYWDQTDTRLLAVETEYGKEVGDDLNKDDKQTNEVKDIDEDDFKKPKEDDWQGKTLETYFVTTQYQIKRQDVVKFEQGEETLLGIQVPYFYYMGRKIEVEDEEDDDKKEESKGSQMIILRKPMKDFVGLEHVEESIKTAIMNFSHYLTVGNMDEAYNSVRNIKNNTVWQNMA
jgi:intraflagellar transport protein 140